MTFKGKSRRAAVLTHLASNESGGGKLTESVKNLLLEKGYEVRLFSTSEKATVPTKPNLILKVTSISRQIATDPRGFDIAVFFDYLGFAYQCQRTKNVNIFGGTEVVRDLSGSLNSFSSFKLQTWQRPLLFLSSRRKINIANSQATASGLRKFCGIEAHVVELGIDVKHFQRISDAKGLRERFGLPYNDFIGLFVGRWDTVQKGTSTLAKIMNDMNSIFWVLACPKDFNQPPASIVSMPNVTLLNSLAPNDLPRLYSAVDFVIMPSAFESFGYVAAEALSCGTVVIGCPATIPALAGVYELDFFRPVTINNYHDAKEFLRAINYVLCNPTFRIEAGKLAKEVVAQKYSLDRWKLDMQRILEL